MSQLTTPRGGLSTLEQSISATARDRGLTQDEIESRIANVEFFIPNGYGGTLCHLTLNNGHVVRGESSCPNDDDAQGLAYTDALNRLWELCRYGAAEERYAMAQAERLVAGVPQ